MTVAKVVDEDSPDAVFAAHHRNEPAWDHPRYVLHHALRERFHLGVVALGRDRHHYVQSLSTAGLEPALQPQLGEHHAGELRGLLKHRPGDTLSRIKVEHEPARLVDAGDLGVPRVE